jgi:signal transduction histidine kinase
VRCSRRKPRHRFRTQLSVIVSGSDLLESYADRLTPERRAEAFTQIRDATSRMNDMIEQVLLLSRIEARRLPGEPRITDVAAPDTLDATRAPTHLRAGILRKY